MRSRNVDALESAWRHGVDHRDMQHALENALFIEEIDELADEAERGYDVTELVQRRRGRPSMGSSAASVESVRLDPELKRDLLLRAARDGTSVSDLIRLAMRQYLRAG